MKQVFRCRSGSHLYGLNRPESDEDYVSIFIPSARELLCLNREEVFNESTKDSWAKRRNTSEDIDDVHYSVSKFLKLALQNNPNILSLLFAEPKNILTLEPEFVPLIENYDRIVSKHAIGTFINYSDNQKKKLTVKASRFFSLQKAIDYLKQEHASKLESEESIGPKVTEVLNEIIQFYRNGRCKCNSFNVGNSFKTVFTMLTKELGEYGWRVATEDFKRLNYDTKFAYHVIRLLGEAKMIMTEGRIIYPITGQLKSDIIRIRSGEVLYDELLAIMARYSAECYDLRDKCTLQENPDVDWANDWLSDTLAKSIIKEYNHEIS